MFKMCFLNKVFKSKNVYFKEVYCPLFKSVTTVLKKYQRARYLRLVDSEQLTLTLY